MAVLANNPSDGEWRKHIGLSATRPEDFFSLHVEWQAAHHAAKQRGGNNQESVPMEVDDVVKDPKATPQQPRPSRDSKG